MDVSERGKGICFKFGVKREWGKPVKGRGRTARRRSTGQGRSSCLTRGCGFGLCQQGVNAGMSQHEVSEERSQRSARDKN